MARTRTNLAAVTAMSVLAMLAGAGCAMEETPIPALSGPSTFGQTISVSITPDVLPQDGQSTARVVVQVTNASGQPVANFPLRLDMYVPADSHNPSSPLVMMDMGQLSTKFPVTGGSGQVQVTYTAPLGAENGNSQRDEIYVTITATPVGSDYSAALARSAQIRLVPLGTIIE
jgi:hypothetical protein